MNRKASVRYSKKLAKFICKKLEEGLSLTEIIRRHPDVMPTRSVVYNWRRNKSDFRDMFDLAYETKLRMHIDELDDLMNAPIPSIQDIEDEMGCALQPTMAKAYLNAFLQQRRLKIDTLKFIASKLASKLVPELKDKVSLEHSGGGINVILPDWSQNIEKLAEGIVIEEEDK